MFRALGFRGEVSHPDRSLENRLELVGRYLGFGEIGKTSLVERFDGFFRRCKRRQHDNGKLVIYLVKNLENHQTVLIGKPKVEQDGVEPLRRCALDGFLSGLDHQDIVSFMRKKIVKRQTDIRIVIDKKRM